MPHPPTLEPVPSTASSTASPLAAATLAACLLLLAAPRPAPAADDSFTLRDVIGRAWSNELVTFPLSRAQLKHAQAGHVLRAADGGIAPCQLIDEGRIAFLANVPPFESREYRFANEPAPRDPAITIEESADLIRLDNGLTGIAIRKAPKGSEGPIAGIRLLSGAWVGNSSITGFPVTAAAADVRARGPVAAEVLFRASGDIGIWTLRIRLQAGEPVATVEEQFSVEEPAAAFRLILNQSFPADRIFYRRGYQDAGGVTGHVEASPLPPADDQPPFVLEPWLHWQTRVRQGNWFSLFTDACPDLLTVGALRPDLWVDLGLPPAKRTAPQLVLAREGSDLTLTFPLKHGVRRWLIGSHDKAAGLAVLQEKNRMQNTLPQQSVIKHGNYPLDVVKDYVLTWPHPPGARPRLLATPADVARLRSAGGDTNGIAQWLKTPISAHNTEAPIRLYLLSGDPELGKRLAALSLEWMQGCVDMLVKQDHLVTLGFAPHHQQRIITTLLLVDTAMSDPGNFTPEQVERLEAQAAFLGYTLARPDNWSPERGFSANPNMTTSHKGYQVAVACFIPSHPLARAWADEGLDELRRQLVEWSDESGGWLEAPHYALVSYDQIVGSFLMARNAGFGDDVFHPRMRKVAEWLGKTSTPPDSRIGGFRHKPPIGNTYLNEPCGLYGILAHVWAEKDPAFAAEMQWMFLQNNAYLYSGIGGAYPAMAGYRSLMVSTNRPAKAPAWGSEWFPKTGVILRSGFATERETQLHMIAGSNHAHYDRDSGSITFWGKGRILADDFGYYGCAPAEDHSLVISPLANPGGIMTVESFVPSAPADYVRGRNLGWRREALLVKDPNPLGPNYLVLADTLAMPAPATWQLWCTAARVTPTAGGALVEGKEDVDMDVVFIQPRVVSLTTEEKTRRSGSGLYTNWSWGPMESTQIGLMAKPESTPGFFAVLYPRFKTEAAPAITPIAEGGGMRLVYPSGTDYVFVASQTIAFKDDAVDFEGTVGVAQFRGRPPALFLGAPGRLSAAGHTVTFD